MKSEMARSKYIYFVREADTFRLLGVFTVKHEANLWAFKNGWDPNRAALSRMRDGVHVDKTEVQIPWAENIEGLVQ